MKNCCCSKEKTVAYGLAEKCLADNLEVTDVVREYLILHPLFAATCSFSKLADDVYELLNEFALND